MKKLLISLGFLAVFALCIKTTSEVSAETNDDYLHDGLAEGETVVDFYTEIVPTDDEISVGDIPVNEEEFTPFARSKRWFPVSKTYTGHTYSGWMYAGASTISGGVLSASHTSSVSNTYSGSLTLTQKDLASYIGFDVTSSWSRTVSYSTHSYPTGKYRLEYRHVYKTWKVKQEQKYDSRGKVYATKYVYPKKWVERQYRVVKLK